MCVWTKISMRIEITNGWFWSNQKKFLKNCAKYLNLIVYLYHGCCNRNVGEPGGALPERQPQPTQSALWAGTVQQAVHHEHRELPADAATATDRQRRPLFHHPVPEDAGTVPFHGLIPQLAPQTEMTHGQEPSVTSQREKIRAGFVGVQIKLYTHAHTCTQPILSWWIWNSFEVLA